MDFAAAGLLDGLEGEEREARERLLEKLAAEGVPLDQLQAAVAEDRLVLLPVERVLGGRYTAAEIAERAGLSASWLLRIRRALGLPEPGPDDRVFGDADVPAAQALKVVIDAQLPDEAILEISRVLGEGMSRLAATINAGFAQAFIEPGDTERDLAERFGEMAEQLTPALSPILISALNAHMREAVRRAMIGREERQAGRVAADQQIVVCFADLVGFTHLGAEIDAAELGSVAGAMAELAAEVADGPVRLVKTIGDAAMFVSAEAPELVEAALKLVRAVEQADLPALRTGIAIGPAQQRAGDWYGHAVNLASRVTGVARPGSVLCTEEVRDAGPDAFAWSYAGRHRVKGVGEPLALYRARPLDAPPTEPDPEPPSARERARERARARDERRASSQRADRRQRRASSSPES